mmetsp:Transcript_42559/g.109892  ORF Transcript_42559/g.109892 Transcript_42559/m.109892 type:complete len:340 (+) Transcript_42559:2564-3583(+)
MPKVIPSEELWEALVPVHAVNDQRAVGQHLVLEGGLVLVRSAVVLLAVEHAPATALHHVRSRHLAEVDLVAGVLALIVQPLQLLHGDVAVRQQLEDLLGPLRHLAIAREDNREGAERRRQSHLADHAAHVAEGTVRLLHRRIHEGGTKVQERRLEAQGEEALAGAAQEVNGACDASEAAKHHEARAATDASLRDTLVVDQADVFPKDRVQEWHAPGLGLDGVREEDVRAVLEQQLRRHLLDGEDRARRGEVLGHLGSCSRVLRVREAAPRARLDEHPDAVLDERGHVGRRQGDAALPLVLVLAADADDAGLATALAHGVRADLSHRCNGPRMVCLSENA